MEKDKTSMKQLFVERAKTLRKARHLSQAQMAELLHITPRAYNDLERGKYCVSTQALVHFLLLLDDQEILEFFREARGLLEQAE